MGRALAGRRDRIVLATKFGHAEVDTPLSHWGAKGSRRYIRQAVEGSLRRLQTDWIDLYQLHTPDPLTPIEETLDALEDLIREGKVRYIGHSNLSGWQIADAEYTARLHGHPRFVSAQNEYNLLERGAEAEVLPAVNAYGLGFLPYFPLHNGLFTGKFSRSGGPADSRIMRQRPHLAEDAPWDTIEAYEALLGGWGVGMLEGTFGWLLAQPGLSSVIAGATTPEQVRANARAASAWHRAPEQVEEISRLFA